MKCPNCGGRMYQNPHNKLLMNCFLCETEMRNPKHKEQCSFEENNMVRWIK